MSPVTSRKTPASSGLASGRPTTRAAQVAAVTAVPSPSSPYASTPSIILSDNWALSNDPVADGFSDIIPEGPPTFTIAVRTSICALIISYLCCLFLPFALQINSDIAVPSRKGRGPSSHLADMDAELGIEETFSSGARSVGKPSAVRNAVKSSNVMSSSSKGQNRNTSSVQRVELSKSAEPTANAAKVDEEYSSDDEAKYLSSWSNAKADYGTSSSNKGSQLKPHPTSAPSGATKRFHGQTGRMINDPLRSNPSEHFAWNAPVAPSDGSMGRGGRFGKPTILRSRTLTADDGSSGRGRGSASDSLSGPELFTVPAASGAHVGSQSGANNRGASNAIASATKTFSDYEDDEVCETSEDGDQLSIAYDGSIVEEFEDREEPLTVRIDICF